MTAIERWFFAPLPMARVAVLRVIAYLFLILDVLYLRPWGVGHGELDPEWYAPLWIGRTLPLPTPTPLLVDVLIGVLVVGSLLGLTGRLPRLVGYTVAVAYLQWMIVSMSYGKVDHDRFGFMLLLFVLPTVGRASLRDRSLSEAAGWALRMVQIGAVATYFLAGLAKLRYGGLDWFNGATVARSVVRRGTELALPLLDYPWTLRSAQWFIMTLELTSPVLLFIKARWQYVIVAGLFGFHVATFMGITIIFFPHLVALLAFLPLERLIPSRFVRQPVAAARPAETVAA
jgi:hypothetical protein